MATTKSTVVGIRLDHERRAWVEAEAARLGLSVRGLFEGMIDEARAAEAGPAARPADSPEDSVRAFRPSVDEVEVPSSLGEQTASEQQESSRPDADWPSGPSSPGSFVPGVGMVAGIPGNILRRGVLTDGQHDRVERTLCGGATRQLRVNAPLVRSLAVNTNTTAAITPSYYRAVGLGNCSRGTPGDVIY